MTIVEENKKYLESLWAEYHETSSVFDDLTIEQNYLVYNQRKVDISNFPINYLFIYGVLNKDNIISLSSEDFFRLVRLYSLTNDQILNSNNIDNENKKENEKEKLEEKQEEYPIVKRINIFNKIENGFPVEYINVVDNNGYDHLYRNDRDFKTDNLYSLIEAKKDITPNEIVRLLDNKLPNVPLSIASKYLDSEKTSESFNNKIGNIDKKYEDDKTKSVLGNEEHDIVIVSDKINPTAHQIITFNVNEYGDIIYENHTQDKENKKDNESSINKNVDEIIYLIPSEDFYALLNSNEEFTEQQEKEVNYYCEYLEDLVTYEDYLTEDLRQILISFKIYINELQILIENGQELTIHQNDILKRYLEWSKKEINGNENSLEHVKTLTYKYKPASGGHILTEESIDERAGFTGTLQVILFVIAFATILTAITLKLLS